MNDYLIIGAAIAILLLGFWITTKITKAIVKLTVFIMILIVLAVLFHDKLPI